VEVTELVAALAEIERAAQEFADAPEGDAAEKHLLDVLRRHSETLNEPYGFDSDTDALRSRVWTDCITIITNLELSPQNAAGQQSDLVRAQVQKLSTMVEGLLDLVRQLVEKR